MIDPPDGRIPFLNDEARRRGAAAAARTPEGSRSTDRKISPNTIVHHARVPACYLPYDIRQRLSDRAGAGYIAIRYEMIHDARVIPLDNRPHLSP